LLDELKHPTDVFHYGWKNQSEYDRLWTAPYGPGEGSTEVAENAVILRATPFKTDADSSVYDHIKHFRLSNQSFVVPKIGSLELAVDINSQTPGTEPGRVIHGCYGPSGSFSSLDQECNHPYAKPTLEGQQASAMMNMTGSNMQLFDWFVSGGHAFALIERLPSSITSVGNFGLDKAYTQIIKETPITAGTHHFSIRYVRDKDVSSVEYFIDYHLFIRVDRVGIPLDVQGAPYTGTYPSLGQGEPLTIDEFLVGHGLFSCLDAFPFQHPDRPDLSVSFPMSERLFGQGAVGSFKDFEVTTQSE
jgi:hypothetical protein